MDAEAIIRKNKVFVRLADSEISSNDFDTYLRVKEKMMMQDILINLPSFVAVLAEQYSGDGILLERLLRDIKLKDVYNTYVRIQDNINVADDVYTAFKTELAKAGFQCQY